MIEKRVEITSMQEEQLPMLNAVIDDICKHAMSVKLTDVLPTVENTKEGELVIYDNDAGTKRLYVITNKKNLGYVNLT